MARPDNQEKTMSPMLSTIGRIATEFAAVRTRYQAARLRYETERALNALPPEVQKDIGWPEARHHVRSPLHGVGHWAGTP